MRTGTARIDDIFTYYAPVKDQKERYELIRDAAKHFGTLIYTKTPQSREQSLALTHLQETVMWANAAIAINE